MRRAAVSLTFLVSCRFELPDAVVDAPPVDVQGDSMIDAPPIDGPGCPAAFAPLSGGPLGHVYLKVGQPGAWLAHFNFCKGTSSRAYLAVPNDATELMNLQVLDGGGAFWVGIDDRVTEGVYVSAETGSLATFLPWAGGEPNQSPADGDCVLGRPLAVVEDYYCAASVPAVCECNP
jgi:hypothetical protein